MRRLKPTTRRRIVLGVLLGAIALLVWLVLLRDEGGQGESFGGVGGRAGKVAAGLSTAEQARQVLAVGFTGEDPGTDPAFEIGPDGLGGVVVGAGNWLGEAQGSALIERVRTTAGGEPAAPLVIAPQEGGPERAFPDLPPAERQIEIGDFADPQRAGEWALGMGDGLRDSGFDVVLSPVGDVAALYSPIAERSFSDSPQVAASMTAAALQGCRAADIACAVGHFPGLGGASQDTDDGPATVSLDLDSLEDRDLAPFAAAIAERAPVIIVSHAFYAAFDPVTPASLSPEVVTGLLRDQLEFRGVAMTDDLSTGAIRATTEVPDAAVEALRAGADLIQITDPADQSSVERTITKAIEDGRLSAERLEQAAGRVLELKDRLGLL